MAISTDKITLLRADSIHADIVADFDGSKVVVPGLRAVGELSAAREKFRVDNGTGGITTLKGVALPIVDAAFLAQALLRAPCFIHVPMRSICAAVSGALGGRGIRSSGSVSKMTSISSFLSQSVLLTFSTVLIRFWYESSMMPSSRSCALWQPLLVQLEIRMGST